jgi:3-deoxy-D-manno-octulosonic-acid transferase
MGLLYEILLVAAFFAYLPQAVWRRRLPHRGWRMRLGRYSDEVRRRLAGRPTLWVHAVSVGEVVAAKPLVEALRHAYPQQPLVLSTITPSGFSVAARQAVEDVTPVYFPLDLRGCVHRALETLRPRILLLIESELWPVMIDGAHRRGIPVAVVNGRISPRAFRRYRWVRPWLGGLLTRIDLFLMQSQLDADRLLQLGAPTHKVRVVGSLKWDASRANPPPPEVVRETAARLGLNGRQAVVVAGSTHRGEEQAVLRAFQTLRGEHPSLRLIIAPRHLERLAEVERLIRQAGLSPVRCSQTPAAEPWDAGIVDTFGELPRYYGLADVVFVGGSLIPHGGQNPLEPASLGKPVVFGPSMHNFADIAHQLTASQAARQIANAAELLPVLQELLAHQETAQAMSRRAQELVARSCGTTQRTLEALAPLLR